MAKCETECRDEIYAKLESKVDKGGVWKFVSIIVVVLGILWTTAFAITSKQGDKIADTKECVARMGAQIDNLEKSVRTLLWEIRRNQGGHE